MKKLNLTNEDLIVTLSALTIGGTLSILFGLDLETILVTAFSQSLIVFLLKAFSIINDKKENR